VRAAARRFDLADEWHQLFGMAPADYRRETAGGEAPSDRGANEVAGAYNQGDVGSVGRGSPPP
jgi:hypothetical protein